MTKSRQLGISWLGIICSCSGANCPTIWVSLCLEGFATGCVLLLDTTCSERETELRGLLQIMAHPNPSPLTVPVPITVHIAAPTTVPIATPTTVPIAVPTTVPIAVSTTVPTTVPITVPTKLPIAVSKAVGVYFIIFVVCKMTQNSASRLVN